MEVAGTPSATTIIGIASRLLRLLRVQDTLVSMQGLISDSEKLGGFRFYNEVLGSPKFVVAPMVDQSELVRKFVFRTIIEGSNHE